ncbi:MAG: rhomboid family intramembrane serine protease [Bacteroides sp.]|jgi:membrane associated rhomboid family serine protease|nr:rhomboid family intramembrane serine protease [Bacteroides sp.]
MFKELKQFFLKGSILARLIMINLGVFILVNFVRLIFFLWNVQGAGEVMTNWLGISSNPVVILTRPWSALTYMFLHFDFFHLIFNMIMLYVGGRLFSDFIGAGRLTATYILGGLWGALFFILAFNLFPVFNDVRSVGVALGASASVLAIFIAISVYMPDFELPLLLVGRIKLKYIALVFVLIDILSIERGNPGGHIAHLGGAFWGFVYAKMRLSGKDPARGISNWFKSVGSMFSRKPRMRVNHSQGRPLSDEEYNDKRADRQKEIDRILDKISQSGYESLSSKEKELLFKMGDKE